MKKNLLVILIIVILSPQALYTQEKDSSLLYIHTSINDFCKRKDLRKSNIFGVLLDTLSIKGTTLMRVTICPDDTVSCHLLSNADSVGKPYYIGISYIEKCQKLFHWINDEINPILDEKTYDKLVEYNYIKRVNVPSHEYLLRGGMLDDGTKIRQYYFVKGHPYKFKMTYSIWHKLPIKYRK